MTTRESGRGRGAHTRVGRGGDRADVRAYVAELTNIAAEAGRAAVENAEYDAEKIRSRALVDGRRARSRAAGDSEQLLMEGRRDALEIVAAARRTADAIVQEAETAEVNIHARMRKLRRVVARTEALLASLADNDSIEVVLGEEPAK